MRRNLAVCWVFGAVLCLVLGAQTLLQQNFDIRTYNKGATTTCGLQEAINSANAVGGGVISIPANFFCTATTGATTGSQAITIRGPGPYNMGITMSASGVTWLTVGTGRLVLDGVFVLGAPGFANVSTNTAIVLAGSTSGMTSQANEQSIISNSHLENFSTAISAANVDNISIYNNILINNNTQIVAGNKVNGDAGLGQIYSNILNCFDGSGNVACLANIVILGPGGAQIHDNNILEGQRCILVELTMGNVSTSGTAVTLVSGGPFLSAWAGKQISINGTSYTVSTVNSPTSMTLTSSAGTQTTQWFYYPIGTSEIYLERNLCDMGPSAVQGIDIEGAVSLQSVSLLGNRVNSWNGNSNFYGFRFNATGLNQAIVDDNNLFSASTTGTRGMWVSAGSNLRFGAGNLLNGWGTGILLDTGCCTGVDLRDMSYFGTTTPISASAITSPFTIDTNASVSFSVLSGLTVSGLSRVGCYNCDTPASQGAACSSSGDRAGAEARYIRGAWRCY